MRFGSVCSGIEAASVAWGPLGWQAAWFSEIEPFPAALLAHHYPETPNHGDMTTLPKRIASGEVEAPDVLCGGTPCQAFSVAGLRKSLDDDRGNLSLVFCEIADALDAVRQLSGTKPAVVFWENVPGVLNTKDNAFGCFLAGLAGEDDPLEPPGDKWTNAGYVLGPKRAVAWRILDAQYFGVAQRRRRVFVIASAREGFDPAAVLFEFDGVRRDIAPSRESGQEITPTIRAGAANGSAGHGARSGDSKDELIVPVAGTLGAHHGNIKAEHAWTGQLISSSTGDVAHCLNAGGMGRQDYETETMVVHGTQDPCIDKHIAFALGRNSGQENALSVSLRGREGGATAELGDEVGNCLRASGGGGDKAHVLAPVCVTGQITHTLKAEGFDASEDGTGRGTPMVPVGVQAEYYSHDYCHDRVYSADGISPALNCSQDHTIRTTMRVRRLTPAECERLQGFPDNYTQIPWRKKPAEDCPDGPRYKALGNSWAVPNVRWIGKRIDEQIYGGLL